MNLYQITDKDHNVVATGFASRADARTKRNALLDADKNGGYIISRGTDHARGETRGYIRPSWY